MKSCIHDAECRVQDCLVFHYRRIVYRVLNIQVDLFSAKFAISFGVSSGYFRTFPFRCLFIDFVLVIRHIKTQHYGSIFCALFSFNWLIGGQPGSSWPTVLLQKWEGRLGDLV